MTYTNHLLLLLLLVVLVVLHVHVHVLLMLLTHIEFAKVSSRVMKSNKSSRKLMFANVFLVQGRGSSRYKLSKDEEQHTPKFSKE